MTVCTRARVHLSGVPRAGPARGWRPSAVLLPGAEVPQLFAGVSARRESPASSPPLASLEGLRGRGTVRGLREAGWRRASPVHDPRV